MIGQVIKYSAVTAKARALDGKRLSDDAWRRLMAASGLRQLWQALGQSGAWGAVSAQPRCAEDASVFTAALRRLTEEAAERLMRYLDGPDRALMRRWLDRPTDGSAPVEELARLWREGGVGRAGLRRIAGAEADGLNLVFILRLRRFPETAARAEEYLLPLRDRLTPALRDRLLRAGSDEEALDILKGTPWADVFRSLEAGQLERQYGIYMAAFCRRALASARPGLTAVQAFLTLWQMESEKLCRLVGAVDRGLDPRLVV